jgi:aspartyl-tRNA synthetase
MANCNWCGDETKPGLYENHKCIEKQKFVVEATLTKHYEIEVEAESVEIITRAEPIPIDLTQRTETNEDLMLKYRYLALRNPELQKNMIFRHKLVKVIRDYFDANNFLEIEMK